MEQSVHEAASAASSSPDKDEIYQRLDTYDWAQDPEFQTGLSTILATAPPDQAQRLVIRARCYYFARKFGERVDFESYLAWSNRRHHNNGTTIDDGNVSETRDASTQSLSSAGESQPAPLPPPGVQGNGVAGADAPHPASFADICQLIAEGKPIPGIKDIPDTVLEGQASVPRAASRRKPWERGDGSGPVSAAAGHDHGNLASVPAWARG